MAYDYSKLIGKIVEVCGSQAAFARKIGISERSLINKLKSRVSWKQPEIVLACAILKIDASEISDYFFNPKVQY